MVGKTKLEMRAARTVPKKYRRQGKRIFDREFIKEQMLEWVEKESSINLCEFCYEHGYLPRQLWTFQQEDQDFEDTYTTVKMKIAERRERMVNNEAMSPGVFNRYQKQHDPFLCKAEDDEKDKDAMRAKGIADQQQLNLFQLAKLASEGTIRQID